MLVHPLLLLLLETLMPGDLTPSTPLRTPCFYLPNSIRSKDKLPFIPLLKFPVENLFAIGSPIGMFLAIRGEEEIPIPHCNNMFNIYHPYDPVAYRLEPLINNAFSLIDPGVVKHHGVPSGERKSTALLKKFSEKTGWGKKKTQLDDRDLLNGYRVDYSIQVSLTDPRYGRFSA